MKSMWLSALFLLVFCLNISAFDPTWDSLDKRIAPDWFDKAKIGIFMHWGVYSVPAVCTEWFWVYWKINQKECVDYMEKNYPPGFSYQDFGPLFTAEFFNATDWAKLFQKAGAKYVVLTTKHHDGFTLFPSRYTFGWNAHDVGPHRDLVKDLSEAIRKSTDIRFGTYYSLYEWYNPIYQADKRSNFTESNFVDHKMIPEMKQLVETYKPEVLWVDGDWEATDTYFKSKEFLAWLYNDSPVKDTVLVNDRWGIGIPCKHGDYYSCADRFNPGTLQIHKWESAMTLDKSSWAYRRNAKLQDYLTTYEMLKTLVEVISCGGNFLLNIGPTKDGTIIPIFQERLTDLGKWLEINGEAIYNSSAWKVQNDTNGITWYTESADSVFALNLQWPQDNVLKLQSSTSLFTDNTEVTLLGNKGVLKWKVSNEIVLVQFPDKAIVNADWVYVLKISSNGYQKPWLYNGSNDL